LVEYTSPPAIYAYCQPVPASVTLLRSIRWQRRVVVRRSATERVLDADPGDRPAVLEVLVDGGE